MNGNLQSDEAGGLREAGFECPTFKAASRGDAGGNFKVPDGTFEGRHFRRVEKSEPDIEIKFTVYGAPVPKARARSVVRHGFVSHYTPQRTVSYEKLVAEEAKKIMMFHERLNGPVRLGCNFFLPIPASYSKKRKEACLRGFEVPTKKPDTDNLLKSVNDALNGIVYKDDSQVVDVYATKRYSTIPAVVIVAKNYEFERF